MPAGIGTMKLKPLLNISEAAVLALHAVELVAAGPGLKTAPEMAARLAVSYNHLAKVMQRLARAGIVSPVRGPKGGFKLTKKGLNCTIGDVLAAVDGSAVYSDCLFGGLACKMGACPFRAFLRGTNARLKNLLGRKVREIGRR